MIAINALIRTSSISYWILTLSCLLEFALEQLIADSKLDPRRPIAFAVSGAWTAVHASELEPLVDSAVRDLPGVRRVQIDLAGVRELDTFGAYLLERLARGAGASEREVRWTGVAERYRGTARRNPPGEPAASTTARRT